MKVRVLKLGTECTDKASRLKGTLTHWLINMDGKIDYLFQPKGLDDEGQPLRKLFLCEARLYTKTTDFEEVEVPFEILGTDVEDKASGFKGMAVEFTRHISGCFHVVIQPVGKLKDKNTPFRYKDFDLRGCKGPKIMELSSREKKKSEEETPSPDGDTSHRRDVELDEALPPRSESS